MLHLRKFSSKIGGKNRTSIDISIVGGRRLGKKEERKTFPIEETQVQRARELLKINVLRFTMDLSSQALSLPAF